MVYRSAYCRGCTYRRNDSKPKSTPGVCPKCGTPLIYLKNWYFQYQFRGKRFPQVGGPTKRVAEVALQKKLIEIYEKKHNIDVDPSTPWNVAREKFLEWAKTNRKHGTYQLYLTSLNSIERIQPEFKRMTLDEIESGDVEDFKTKRLISKAVKVSTLNVEITSIKRMFTWATEQSPKLLLNNRIKDVDLFKETKGRIRFLTEEEQNKLLEQCHAPHLKMAVTIALNTGLRRHGCLTLKWSEMDNDYIRKIVKGGKLVTVPITNTLREALSEYRRQSVVMSRYVIPSPADPSKHIAVNSDIGFATALKSAGITDFHFHDLRHTFATNFLQEIGDLRALQEILGHSDIKMTEKYTHVVKEHLKELMGKFDRSRNGGE
jgi:integrase